MSHKNAVILADLLTLRRAGKRPKWPVFITEFRFVAETCEALGLPWLWLGDKRFDRDWKAMRGLECIVVYAPKSSIEHESLEAHGVRIVRRFGFWGFVHFVEPFLHFDTEVA